MGGGGRWVQDRLRNVYVFLIFKNKGNLCGKHDQKLKGNTAQKQKLREHVLYSSRSGCPEDCL